MKKLIKVLVPLVSIAFIFLLGACSDSNSSHEGKIQFGMDIIQDLKSSLSNRSNEVNQQTVSEEAKDKKPVKVRVSISSKDNKTTLDKVLAYDNLKGISKILSLKEGKYELTGFSAQNQADETIYLSPLDGSEFAQYVNDPLPIEFTITEDEITQVKPEVVSYNESIPIDKFGYVDAKFIVVEMTMFNLVVFDSERQPTSFHLKVSSNKPKEGEQLTEEKVFIDRDLEAKSYKVRIPNTYDEFDIEVSKADYKMQTFHKTLEELKEMIYPRGFLMVYLESDSN